MPAPRMGDCVESPSIAAMQADHLLSLERSGHAEDRAIIAQLVNYRTKDRTGNARYPAKKND